MFSGVFNDMQPNEITALLSCLVHDERTNENVVNIKNERLSKALLVLFEHAKRILKVYQESKLIIDEVLILTYEI